MFGYKVVKMKHYQKFGIAAFVLALTLVLVAAGTPDNKPLHAQVKLDRMQAFYIGVDNPIHISVDGVSPADVKPTITGGSITGSNGEYIVRCTIGLKAKLIVNIEQNGKTVPVDTFDYRIKTMPDPVTYVGSVDGDGVILKENLVNVTGIFTRMVNFDFDGRFTPQSFSMSVIENGEWKEYKSESPACTEEMKAALQKCEEEDKIIFHNVMTKGPAGDVRHVNGVIITVK